MTYSCSRCKTGSTNRKDTYCTDCRGKAAALFMKETDDSPMERALRFVEKRTSPRENWEHIIGHKYVQAANKIAKKLAGVPESRSVKGAPLKPSPLQYRKES